MFCGRHLLAAKLRRANIDAAAGSVEEVARIVAHIRRRWPLVRILVRADSGFAREELMAWCEANGVHFLFGLAKNDRLIAEIKTELDQAAVQSRRTGKPARRFKDFRWTTRSSWNRRRRVVAKAEWTKDEANPRFVVTSLTRAECKARYLYEKVYCARGDMENRIKECQLDLYADRTSTATMRANQLRLWFASMAYVLLCALRRIGLHHTPFAKATCGTIRLKLLKIGALVRVSVRRIKVAMASACPAAHAWGCAAASRLVQRIDQDGHATIDSADRHYKARNIEDHTFANRGPKRLGQGPCAIIKGLALSMDRHVDNMLWWNGAHRHHYACLDQSLSVFRIRQRCQPPHHCRFTCSRRTSYNSNAMFGARKPIHERSQQPRATSEIPTALAYLDPARG